MFHPAEWQEPRQWWIDQGGWVQSRQQALLFHPAIELLDESLETAAAQQTLLSICIPLTKVLGINEGMVKATEAVGGEGTVDGDGEVGDVGIDILHIHHRKFVDHQEDLGRKAILKGKPPKVGSGHGVEQVGGEAIDDQISITQCLFSLGGVIWTISKQAWCVPELDVSPAIGMHLIGGHIGGNVDVATAGEGRDDGGFAGAVLPAEGKAEQRPLSQGAALMLQGVGLLLKSNFATG